MNRITRVVADTTAKMLFRPAMVTAVADHGQNFRTVELTGDALKKAAWHLGDKVQVRTGPDSLSTRTYTPCSWDPGRGSTTLLAFAHGAGPGATWVKSITAGQACQLFGPRGSLKLDDVAGPIVFVGDETSFALAASWRRQKSEIPPVAELFEVTDPDESGAALDAFGLRSARLFPRTDGATHLHELSTNLTDVLRTHPGASLCLTGRAQSIATIRRDLKSSELTGRSTRVKAYWDENRTGLD